MRSRYVEAKEKSQKRIEQERQKAYKEGFEAGKKSVSVNKPSGKGSPAKRKSKPK